MDKNMITGLVLMAVVFIGFSYFNRSEQTEALEAAQLQAVTDTTDATKTSTGADDIITKAVSFDSTSVFAGAHSGTSSKVTLQNDEVIINLDTKGGRVTDVVLKNYNNQQKQPLTLFNASEAGYSLLFVTDKEKLSTNNYYFTPSDVTDTTVTMRLVGANGEEIKIAYKLSKNNYMLDMIVTAQGMANMFTPQTNSLIVDWHQRIRQQEKGYQFEQQYSKLTYKFSNETGSDNLSESSYEEVEESNPIDWIAFKNQFFSSVMIAYPGFTHTTMSSKMQEKGSGYLKYYKASMQTAFDPTGAVPTKLQFYFGPNKYRHLQKTNSLALDSNKDLHLEDLVYLGWPVFRWINRFFTIYVFDWLTSLGFSMGIVLLLITLLLRVIVYPTTKKSYMSSVRMRVLKPKIEEINQKYPNKEDALKKNQEVMTLYSQYGASPMGGCLPMLIQMPIWIAMFNFVPNAIELRQQGFLWADDLSTYDDIISWSTELPLIGNHLSLFCLLFSLANLAYSYFTIKQQRDTMVGEQQEQAKIMQWMMYLMPVIFFFTFNNYSSGLNYYYFISLLAGALTMWYLKKTVDEKRVLAKLEENYKRNMENPQNMKGMGARLEALRKKQEEQMQKYGKK